MMDTKTATVLYVATDGNDNWSGKLAKPNACRTGGPFASLARARNAIRELKAGRGLKRPVTVLVRGGKYCLARTLKLGSKDSGTRECPVTYSACPGERPILSGGKRLTGWQPYKESILQCKVPGARGGKWKFRQLFLDGKRQIRARYPNFDPDNPLYGGWAFMEDAAEKGSHTAFRYERGTFPRRWAKPTQAEINVFPYINWGNNAIVPIKSIDENKRIITLAHSVKQFGERWTHFQDIAPFIPGNRFVVENVLEELDQPGEWCLDSEDGILYFWPPDGSIRGHEVVAPSLDCLIDLADASWITISGFTFTETTGGDNTHRHGLEGVGAMFPMKGWKYCGEAIHLRGTRSCTIEDNHFDAVGGNAVYLEKHNQSNMIRRNEIAYAGANAICLVGAREGYPRYNQILDNHIHHCGFFNKYVAGVFFGLSTGNIVGHNLIEYVPHHSVNFGNCGFGRNIVEYNELRHAAMETRDTASVNCWMEEQKGKKWARGIERSGHVIRYNIIADVQGCSVDSGGRFVFGNPDVSGVYLDDWTGNCFVYGNIFVRIAGAAVFLRAENNIIENNIMVDCGSMYRHDAFGPPLNSRVYHNIYSYSTPTTRMWKLKSARPLLYALYCHDDAWIQLMDNNLFFNNGGGRDAIILLGQPSDDDGLPVRTISLAEWREMGHDEQSIVADPLFANAAKDDYRLKRGSPALKLGFQPIDISEIGMRRK